MLASIWQFHTILLNIGDPKPDVIPDSLSVFSLTNFRVSWLTNKRRKRNESRNFCLQIPSFKSRLNAVADMYVSFNDIGIDSLRHVDETVNSCDTYAVNVTCLLLVLVTNTFLQEVWSSIIRWKGVAREGAETAKSIWDKYFVKELILRIK